jgi:hypothetical protein
MTTGSPSYLDSPSLGGDDPGADGDVELPSGNRFDPDVVALKDKERC